jgi:hypothetical protein
MNEVLFQLEQSGQEFFYFCGRIQVVIGSG